VFLSCCVDQRCISSLLTAYPGDGIVFSLCDACIDILVFPQLTHHGSIPITDFSNFRSIAVVKMPIDLLHPSAEQEAKTHKLKRLVQSPNSFFMDIKCPGCFQITTVFSHAQSVVLCGSCNVMLCQPTGGRARLTEGCSYRKKVD